MLSSVLLFDALSRSDQNHVLGVQTPLPQQTTGVLRWRQRSVSDTHVGLLGQLQLDEKLSNTERDRSVQPLAELTGVRSLERHYSEYDATDALIYNIL